VTEEALPSPRNIRYGHVTSPGAIPAPLRLLTALIHVTASLVGEALGSHNRGPFLFSCAHVLTLVSCAHIIKKSGATDNKRRGESIK